MTQYFKEEYYIKSKKQRKKCLAVYFVTLAVFALALTAVTVWYALMPYKHPNITIAKIIANAISMIFVTYSFIYLGIKFKRVNNYYKLCQNVKTGLRETADAQFIRVENGLSTKDGVDCKILVFRQLNKHISKFYERQVYVFYEEDAPEFLENANVKLITQGNFLVEYEII